MAIEILDRTIERVSIVDDDEEARDGYKYSVEDLDLAPVTESGPIRDLNEFLNRLETQADAILCDYRLRKHNYAAFDGDEVVAACYDRNFPAILCTTVTDWYVTLMRKRRRKIPVLVDPYELEPDTLVQGLERCIQEFNGVFQPSRAPSRALVRVVDKDPEGAYFYVVLPGWNARKKVRIDYDDLPDEMRDLVEIDKRFHAQANVGAESHEDLYLDLWEPE